MPKESTHAMKHWLEIEADAAVHEALDSRPGYHFHGELLEPCELQDIADDFRAGVGDRRYYEDARLKAIRLAARLLRVAVMAHREAVR